MGVLASLVYPTQEGFLVKITAKVLIVILNLALFSGLSSCAEVGSEKWCKKMEENPLINGRSQRPRITPGIAYLSKTGKYIKQYSGSPIRRATEVSGLCRRRPIPASVCP